MHNFFFFLSSSYSYRARLELQIQMVANKKYCIPLIVFSDETVHHNFIFNVEHVVRLSFYCLSPKPSYACNVNIGVQVAIIKFPI